MARDRRSQESRGEEWIFASDDPGTLSTDRLPDRAEFDRYSEPLLAERARRRADEPDAATGSIPALEEDGAPRAGATPSVRPDPGELDRALPRPASYARSGTTPNVEDADPRRAVHGVVLPDRFRDLGIFDALRDVLALICLITALTTTFTVGSTAVLDLAGRIAIVVAVVALIAVHLLRWIPRTVTPARLALVRTVRIAGLVPALAVPIAVVVTDLVLSLPVLFAALPDGPPVGVGVGVALMGLGAIVGIEPRAHEGYLPQAVARRRARVVLVMIGAASAVMLALALVMAVGRITTTGWGYSLLSLGDSLISALLIGIVLTAALRRDRTWYVFCAAAIGGLVAAALADNTLELAFAAPVSVATGFVYLPLLFAAFGVMISRSFVRTMPLSFRRADWLVYTVRAFEFSAIMHAAAAVWQILAALSSAAGYGGGGVVLHVLGAAVCVCFVGISLFARNALLERPAVLARAIGVVSGIALIVVGFLDVIVNAVAAGAGAGLTSGGLALAIGIAAALMLTVPAPVRDEFGAPDLGQMFADFRTRDTGRVSLLDRVPDVSAERARKKPFPRG